MTRHEKFASLSRRNLLKAGGALVVSFGAPLPFDSVQAADDATAVATKPPLTPDQLSSYLAVNADGTVSAYFGKMDMGQGLSVAIRQMVAEELDVPFKTVKIFIGDTATSVNQGGASGSTGVQEGGRQMRMAAAEARRVLVEMAANKLGLAADQLTVTDGVVRGATDATKKLSYAELIGGQFFNVHLDWNGKYGNPLYAPGKAQPKDPKDHTIVGQPVPRDDIAPKVFAQTDFVTDVKVPGMMHGRMIRPEIAGAIPVSVDESSIKDIPSAKVVWDKGFLGVVADKEWDAIKAANALKVTWSNAAPPFLDQAALYEHIRSAAPRKHELQGKQAGNVDDAFKTAARVIEAEYSGRSSRMPAWGRPARWSRSRTAVSRAGAARRKRISCRPASLPSCKCRRTMSASSGRRVRAPMAAAMRTIARWMPRFSPKPSASRCACNICAIRAPGGIPRRPLPFTRCAPRSMRRATSSLGIS